MTTFIGAKDIAGNVVDVQVDDDQEVVIHAHGLTQLPGLIDPHVHFRTPGHEYKEDWRSASLACVCGGYTTVFDMPNNKPACITRDRLLQKKQQIDAQLQSVNIPLRYGLYIGADKNHFDELAGVKDDVVGLKIFMGSSTGDLLMDDDESLDRAFALAAQLDMLVAVHAEDECLIQERTARYAGATDYSMHSVIRSPDVAARAVEKAIGLAEKYGARLYILHVSTKLELDLIAKAKQKGLSIYAEVCPHHLFLNETAYATLKGRAQMNPPLRSEENRLYLFRAIAEGIVDTVGSDHAPHTLSEKDRPYGNVSSGVPGVETTLPLLLTAVHDGLLSLERLVELTSRRVQTLFGLAPTRDSVLVDLNMKKQVLAAALKTQCAWSPYEGMWLTGWPVYTLLNHRVFDLELLRG